MWQQDFFKSIVCDRRFASQNVVQAIGAKSASVCRVRTLILGKLNGVRNSRLQLCRLQISKPVLQHMLRMLTIMLVYCSMGWV